MTGTDFLLSLRDRMPPRSELEAYGLSPDEIMGIQAVFQSVPRQPSGLPQASELEKMILDYDCSTVEVGLVRFLDRPCEHRHGIQVAFCEADPIVVSPAGTIVMYDHADPDFAINCAADSERFLDALITFLTIVREKSKWIGRGNEAVDLCAEKAGGRDYSAFFSPLGSFLS